MEGRKERDGEKGEGGGEVEGKEGRSGVSRWREEEGEMERRVEGRREGEELASGGKEKKEGWRER